MLSCSGFGRAVPPALFSTAVTPDRSELKLEHLSPSLITAALAPSQSDSKPYKKQDTRRCIYDIVYTTLLTFQSNKCYNITPEPNSCFAF